MDSWGVNEGSRDLRLSRRVSIDDIRHSKFPLPSTLQAFTRPISALARHRVHQLSEIREVSGSSKAPPSNKPTYGGHDSALKRPVTPRPIDDTLSHTTSSECLTPTGLRGQAKSHSRVLGSRAPSAISLPVHRIPQRRSSASILSHSPVADGPASAQDLGSWTVPELDGTSRSIPNYSQSGSPVRRALGKAAQSSDLSRSCPAKTIVRTTPPYDILDHGSIRNSRVETSVHLPCPLFVGGGTVEGSLTIEVDGSSPRKAKSKPLFISKASVDVIGVEDVSDGRRWVFLSLAAELLDEFHPPPPSLVTSQQPIDGPELWWELRQGAAKIPFKVNLPLKLGPPPYSSKHASIRYLLCTSVVIRVGDKRGVVRQTWSIQMLTVHDPERALASLPSPLLAADTLYLSQEPDLQVVKLTAGLHRQTWVNGGMIFIDIHVSNNSARSIKKVEVQLEKTTLWYTHPPVGTSEKTANYLRLPRRTDTAIVSASPIKKSSTWNGVAAHSSDTRTIELEAPKGHVTISSGRYFEVRYFVNVVLTVKMFKTIAVQLPVTIIPMNSLDILPNALAQVAASIEAKRARTVPVAPDDPVRASFRQGQAFMTPVRQSLDLQDRGYVGAQDLDALARDVDKSPRRYAPGRCVGEAEHLVTNENVPTSGASVVSSHHHHLTRHPSCYHCHLTHEKELSPKQPGPRLPRLQVSTSGLGFSESEFEVPPDSPPKKVMLSEEERNMINQIRELRARQPRNPRKTKRPSKDNSITAEGRPSKEHVRFTNVIAEPEVGPKQPEHGNLSPEMVLGQKESINKKIQRPLHPQPTRSRAQTNPEALSKLPGPTRRRNRSTLENQTREKLSADAPGPGRMPMRPSREINYRASLDRLF